ncbi:MAG TPA: hypothetical protein VI612_02510, partial [Candidatus Nanoarchaeia archaeon]|nr:hypothetical protein [Candidatus Nanoarchaeia archaeon]
GLARAKVVELKNKTREIEEARQKAETLAREIQVNKAHLYSRVQQHAQLLNDINHLNGQLQQEILPVNIDEITRKTADYNQSITKKEKEIREHTSKIAEYNALKRQAAELSLKIRSLDNCPTCLQTVTSDHKTHILTTQQQKIVEFDSQLQTVNLQAKQFENELAKLKEEIEELRKQEREAMVLRVKYAHYQENLKRKAALEAQANLLKTETDNYAKKTAELEIQIKPLAETAKLYDALRKELETAAEQERTTAIQHATLKQKEQYLTQTITLLENELDKKTKARKQLENIQKTHQMLTDFFEPLMDVIEKHVMAKIHHEFDALFQQWFGMLVDDTIMTARLDETFTPIVQQNGYEIEVEHLSGGERTACALAYRLALNKTINSLINNIKTKDLLILDEPTDGFSTEQLDRMRDVLEQLNLKQIIIVSHEQKIESFADRVIRVQKAEHMSQIT